MKKKFLSIILIAVVSIGGVACGNTLANKSLKNAKTFIENKEYDKALMSLEMTLDEDSENGEANKLYRIVEKYIESKKLVGNNKFSEAEDVINKLNSSTYKGSAIEEDINNLKEEINKHKEKEKVEKEEKAKKEQEKKEEKERNKNQKENEINNVVNTGNEVSSTKLDQEKIDKAQGLCTNCGVNKANVKGGLCNKCEWNKYFENKATCGGCDGNGNVVDASLAGTKCPYCGEEFKVIETYK